MTVEVERHSQLEALAAQLGEQLGQHRLRLATAESCTGGLIAALLTAIPGSSAWFERGFVCYSNAAKQEQLGVSAETLASYGAVSAETVFAMASGACRYSRAETSLAVSGVAGPGGGSAQKPVGTVWLAWALPDGRVLAPLRQVFNGGRSQVRARAAEAAMAGLITALESL